MIDPPREMRPARRDELPAAAHIKASGDAEMGRRVHPFLAGGEPDLAAGLYLRHLGIYAYRGAFLKQLVQEPPCLLERTESLEQLRALYLGARIAVIQTEDLGVGVDTPEDVPAVEAMLRQRVESEGQESKE